MSTAYLVRWGGPVYESDDAYGDGYTPSGLTPRKHVQEVNWIPARGSALDNDNIKNAVMQYGGVDVSMGWYGSGGLLLLQRHDHELLLQRQLGHQPRRPHRRLGRQLRRRQLRHRPSGQRRLHRQEQLGHLWGSSGYFYVSYYDTKFGRDGNPMAVFNGAESTSNYTGIYQYDPLGDCAQLRVLAARPDGSPTSSPPRRPRR